MVKIESMNRHDIHAVAIYRDAEIACSLQSSSKNVSIFMRVNKAFAEITGAKVNRGAGYMPTHCSCSKTPHLHLFIVELMMVV